MAWYNIIDNTAGALSARSECNELEKRVQALQSSTESLIKDLENQIHKSEKMYNEQVDTFKTSLKNVWDTISNLDNKSRACEISQCPEPALNLSTASYNKSDVSAVDIGSVVAASTGGIAALGAYTAVGILGTASTGTAIGTLTGVYATNATLAWFGGGALAAGGGGMALGATVLGGIVAAPVLFVLANQAKKYYEETKAALDRQLVNERGNNQSIKAQGRHIEMVCSRVNKKIEFLQYIGAQFVVQTDMLRKLEGEYEEIGDDVFRSVLLLCIDNITSLQEAASTVLSTPLVSESGVITSDITLRVREFSAFFNSSEWHI